MALYPRLLGPDWEKLDPQVRAMHLAPGSGRVTGSFRVRHGPRPFARLLARLLRLPSAGDGIPTRLEVRREGAGERWERHFGGSMLVTTQRPGRDGLLIERFGMLEFRLRLAVMDGGLAYEQQGAAFRVGGSEMALPRWLAPQVAGSEMPAAGDRVIVRVSLTAPQAGLIVSYEGEVVAAPGGAS